MKYTRQKRNLLISRFIAVLLIQFLFAVPAFAGSIAVIVNKGNAEAIDQVKLKRIFTKEYRIWKDGQDIIPVDLKDGADSYENFVKTVIGKDPMEIKSFWIQKKITKNLKEPLTLKSSAKVKSFVNKIANSIGYIPKADVDDTVRVVLEIN